jgi:hypothetical protein
MRAVIMRKEDELNTLLRLNARAWGIAVGMLFGLGIFFATVLLVVKGGPTVGPHLGLIAQFLPGYRVTWGGAFVGFVYLFVIGYAVGRVIGWVYNSLARSE